MSEEDLDMIPSPQEQKALICSKFKEPLRVGESWFVVDAEWMRMLKIYLGIIESPVGWDRRKDPGPIDNTHISENGALLDDLTDGMEYELVNEELWNKLVEWYGLAPNSVPIRRRVIRLSNNYLIVEVYSVELRCSPSFSMVPERNMSFSRITKMLEVQQALKDEFEIDEQLDTRLWLQAPNTLPELVNSDKTLSDLGVMPKGYCCIIESKLQDAKWSSSDDITSKKYSNDISRNSNVKVARTATSNQPGVCGLSNLGNTCFMNCVLQCLSNCPPIIEYILARKHLEELNKVNPLGMGGEIAIAFANLMNTMWSGDHRSTSPMQFKIQLGHFNPVFSGWQQHDSQELLTFLLDGLHEDLNRIKQKPYTVINDDSDRDDKILAQEAWDRHRKRNDSIIVDTFHGMLKSRVVCPDCKKLSVTFDPFCNLSLPLPQKRELPVNITFIPFDGSKQIIRCKVFIPRQGIISDLCFAVSERIGWPDPDSLMVAEISHHHFHKFYCRDDTLDNIVNWEMIYVYEILTEFHYPFELLIPVYLWKVSPIFEKEQLFSIPFFIGVAKQPISEDDLYQIVLPNLVRNFEISALNGLNKMDIHDDKNDLLAIKQIVKQDWKIYTKNTAAFSALPTPLEFNEEGLDLSELFDVDDSSETYFRRNIMILGFTETTGTSYVQKKVEYVQPTWGNRQSKAMDKITMTDCLNLFTTCEKLGADDAWYCPTCKKHQRVTKKFDLWDLPKILIIHLKRFSYTRLLRDKIDTMVDCPLKNLDMSQYLIKRDCAQSVYNLIGVCNHFGTMGGGHYTACCKNKDTGKWYYFDDSSVEQISEDRVLTKAAYILFYLATDAQ